MAELKVEAQLGGCQGPYMAAIEGLAPGCLQPGYFRIWSRPQQSSSEACCLLPQRCLHLFVGGTPCCEVSASDLSGFALWRTYDSKCLQVRYTSSLCSFFVLVEHLLFAPAKELVQACPEVHDI